MPHRPDRVGDPVKHEIEDDINDRPFSQLDHVIDQVLGNAERTKQIYRQHMLQVSIGARKQVSRPQKRGIVYQDVDPPKPLNTCGHCPRNILGPADIALYKKHLAGPVEFMLRCLAASASESASTTDHSRSRNKRAVLSPIPEAAPVMKAHEPFCELAALFISSPGEPASPAEIRGIGERPDEFVLQHTVHGVFHQDACKCMLENVGSGRGKLRGINFGSFFHGATNRAGHDVARDPADLRTHCLPIWRSQHRHIQDVPSIAPVAAQVEKRQLQRLFLFFDIEIVCCPASGAGQRP